MKPGKTIKVSSIPWVVIVLAFVLLYAAYFLLYIPQQESLVEKRAFRVLKEYAENMQDKLEYYETHIKNYSPYYSIDFLSKNNNCRLKDFIDQAIRKSQQVQTLIANLDKTITTEKIDSNGITENVIFDNVNYKLKFKGADESNVREILRSLVSENPGQINLDSVGFLFEHSLPMTTFLDNLKFDKLLGNIALFSDNAAIYNTSLEVIQDITNPGLLADTLNKLQGGLCAEINIRGEKNHVMVLPFTFLGTRLYLAGFITDNQFRQKTRDINNQFLTTLAGILLLLLFGMPILKILFISRKEQLRAMDASATTISMIFGIGFFILIMLSVMKQFVVDRQNLRLRINDVSEILCNNVNSDFERITQLYEDITSNGVNPKSNKALVKTVQNIFKEKSFVDQLLSTIKYESDNIGKIPDEYMKKEFPLNEVFLIADNGLLKKIVSRTGATSLVPVDLSKRNYFKTMKKNSTECWTYKTPSGQIQPYFIESLKSYNSGKKEVAFSFRLQEKVARQFGANIMAITSPMPSLFNQVLPEDVSFLIIDKRGDVLFHSDQSKNLHENFLNECDENMRLIGAMNHRVADIVRIDYNEKNWLAKIVPLKNAPLFHITLIDYGLKHDKNARILFFTFYFMIATFILILLGIGIIYLSRLNRGDTSSKTWIFHWLLFRVENRRAYIFLLIVQSVLFVFQLLGLLINDKPVTMFFYQTIFVVFSASAALIVLGNFHNGKAEKTFTLLAFPQSIFYAVTFIFIGILVWIHQKDTLLYPVAAVVIMSVVLIRFANLFVKNEKGQDEKILNAALDNRSSTPQVNPRLTRNVFHFYVFIWLLGISAAPAIQYYHSVKMQEGTLWKRYELEYAAIKNLELDVSYRPEMRESDWYKKTAGEGIDFLKINRENKEVVADKEENLSQADWFYTILPDPVTKGNHLTGLLRNSNYYNEWQRERTGNEGIRKMVDDNVLFYSQAGTEGQIRVEQCGNYMLGAGKWLLYFTLPIILMIVFLWFLFRYVAQSVLRTIALDWESAAEEKWEDLLEKEGKSSIMLITFSGEEYFKITGDVMKKKRGGNASPAVPLLFYGDNLPDSDEIRHNKELHQAEIIWIRGLDEIIKDPKKLGKQLAKLTALCEKMTGKLVVELAFGFDFIREYYEELINESAADKTETLLIWSTHTKLETFFRDFYKYTGAMEESMKLKDLPGYLGLEPRYRYFWNNLTSLEKLILTDLSEDGMLNYKNKQLLNQLKMKGLVTFTPFPQIFSDGFSYFLSEVIDPGETHELQSNMRKQGNWHNMRYLILLILIPLIIFIMIAQGTSIEKVIGIATGGLAVLSGIIRLFESDFLRQGSKAK